MESRLPRQTFQGCSLALHDTLLYEVLVRYVKIVATIMLLALQYLLVLALLQLTRKTPKAMIKMRFATMRTSFSSMCVTWAFAHVL